MGAQTKHFYAFGPFRLDSEKRVLVRDGVPIALAPKAAETLLVLVQNAGRLVEKDEWMARVWPDAFVEEGNLSRSVFVLRQLLGQWEGGHEYIETVPKRGYRFVAPVEEVTHAEVALRPKPSLDAVRRSDPSVGTSLIGKKVSHYRVLEVVGGGGMGLVYKAEDLKLGRRVALKFLPEELANDPVTLQRFEREAQTASSLNHPNICTIHEVEEHEGQPFIVMELLEGETLRDRLASSAANAVPLELLLNIALQIGDGLQAAHERGIIHRDIKPANIFLTNKDVCKILDFGLAKLVAAGEKEPAAAAAQVKADNALKGRGFSRAVAASSFESRGDQPFSGLIPAQNRNEADDGTPEGVPLQIHAIPDAPLTRIGLAMGTAGYMSPEQVRGEKLDSRTDIFSFGLVLYEMATGQRAFTGETEALLHNAILNKPPLPARDLNSTVPAKLATIIDKALEKDRERRYQSAAEMRADLKGIMPDGQVAAHSSARKWAAAAVIVLLVLAGFSAVIYTRLAAAHPPHLDLQNMKITSLTDNPKVGVAAISPDGRYVAYSLREPQQSLWVQQVSPESKVEVAPPSAGAIWAVTFSPDGNSLYFVRDSKGYVVPALGGTPRLIIEDTFSGIAVSPDGRKLAFVHGGDDPKSQLIVVNQDGSGAHVIAEHDRGSGMRFNSVAAPSWSPDGTLIAMPATRKTDYVLGFYPAEGGPPGIIPLPGSVIQSLWLPDQSGLLLTISSSIIAPAQIWLQPFPKGTLQRLTNGLDGYLHLSLSKDGRSLAAVRVQTSYNMFVGPASKPDEGTAVSKGKSDGIGLAWMPDGNLLSQNVDSEFSSLTPDGKRRVTLFKDRVLPGDFSLCRNGRFLVFGRSTLGDLNAIWRLDFTGHNLKQLTEGPSDMGPDCSPDSQSVIYDSVYSSQSLRRIPIDGGTPAILSDKKVDKEVNVDALRYSPDGQQIADIEDTSIEVTQADLALIVRNSQSGQKLKSFGLPAGLDLPYNSLSRELRWTADGRTVTYFLEKGAVVNLWSQSLEGGPPRQITNFPDAIVAYDWSPDGKQLALTRSTQSRDVVLISNFH